MAVIGCDGDDDDARPTNSPAPTERPTRAPVESRSIPSTATPEPVPPGDPVTDPPWLKTGGPVGGLGYDVRIRPEQPDTMFATDAFAGLHKSVDGGHTWFASNRGIDVRLGPSGDAVPVFSVSIAPNAPETLWAGTQDVGGIFKSTDGGAEWQRMTRGIAEAQGFSIRGFGIHPHEPDIVFAAGELASIQWAGTERPGKEFDMTRGVVYRSTNGGANWEAVWRGDNLARYVWICPRNPNIVLVSTGIFDREAANSDPDTDTPGGVGVLKSVDSGNTWRVLGPSAGLENLYVGSLAMHPEETNVLLAAAGNNAYFAGSGVFRSSDMGENWERVLSGVNEPFTAVSFSLADSEVAYAASAEEFFRSEDGGRSWQLVDGGDREGFQWGPSGIRAGVPISVDVDPRDARRVFVNNYGGGVFRSDDGGSTWFDASQGYTGAELHDVAVARNDALSVFTIGRSGVFGSTDGGGTWEGLNFEPASFAEWYAVAVSPMDPNHLVVSDEHEGVLLRSTDGGLTWRQVFKHPGVVAGVENRQGFKVVAFAESDSRVLYAGMCHARLAIENGQFLPSFGVFKSADGGATWEAASDALTSEENILALAIDPTDPDVVYVGSNNGVFKSSDGGMTWQEMNGGLTTIDPLVVNALAINPGDSDVLYAGLEGGVVARTEDGGVHWDLLTTGSSEESLRDIAIDPIDTRLLYSGSFNGGVSRSEDGGETWIQINAGLDTRAVKALALSPEGGWLYAATQGGGVFRARVRE